MKRRTLGLAAGATATLIFTATLLSLGAVPSRAAAPEGSSWQITPYAGEAFFIDGVTFPGNKRIRVKDALHYGGKLGWQPNRLFGLQIGGGYTTTDADPANGNTVSFIHSALDVMISPIQAESWDLYGLMGGGYERFKTGDQQRDFGSFDIGAGLRLWVSDKIAIRAEARNILPVSSKFETSTDNYALVTGGLTWALGGVPKDADADGVSDRKDTCPDTPAGATVDAKGCPTDSDGDGVWDGIDTCPNSPKGARVDARGCPTDLDGDGVFDGLDQCADSPRGAKVDVNGCPIDGDGDGVPDGIDTCPDTPKGATVGASGCPTDSDGDGVWDGLDLCAGTAAGLKVDKDGCPIEVTERETELLDTGMIRLQDINFETAKADIKPESFANLDVVGQVLSKWPELKIEVGGHTDSRGSNAYNQLLSEARARSVEKYLLEKFPTLKTEQFTVKGYGESKPVEPNTNALNMAKNRRVEFVVQNKEVLKKESERRKLLNK